MIKACCQSCFDEVNPKLLESYFETYGNFCPRCTQRAIKLASVRAGISKTGQILVKLKAQNIETNDIIKTLKETVWREEIERHSNIKVYLENRLEELKGQCRQYLEVL